MAGILRTRQRERFSLPFSVYRRKNDRSVTILILKERASIREEKTLQSEHQRKTVKSKSNF